MLAGKSSNDWGEQNDVGQEQALASEKTRIQVSELMGGDREVFLLFNGAEYRLRVTNNNKLILTK